MHQSSTLGGLRSMEPALSPAGIAAWLGSETTIGGERMTRLQALSTVTTMLLVTCSIIVIDGSLLLFLLFTAIASITARPIMRRDNQEGGER